MPLELINNKEMILHVYESAKKTNAEEVYVATPDKKIIDIINPWNKRGYNLVAKISFEKQLGKTVNIDDVALIKNSSDNSRVSIHC